MFSLILILTSIAAGFLGSLLGLGGGIILVPVMTLVFKIHIRYAIAASLISIIATSSGAAAGFLRDRLTNLRLAVLLELGTVSGAIVGFLLAQRIDAARLFLIFGLFLLFSAVMMLRNREDQLARNNHPWAERLGLGGQLQGKDGSWRNYYVQQVPVGLIVMFFAGILSALLGIGSGIFKVLAMDQAMKLPIKVSSATSNFMIGVTASASAGAYLLRGDIHPEIAAPVSIGIIMGSWFGARAMVKIPAEKIRQLFVVILVVVSFQMIWRGVKG